jgi:hypothetical protein
MAPHWNPGPLVQAAQGSERTGRLASSRFPKSARQASSTDDASPLARLEALRGDTPLNRAAMQEDRQAADGLEPDDAYQRKHAWLHVRLPRPRFVRTAREL